MGGLVIRGALKYLEEYKDNFHTLMTSGCPHTGFCSPKTLVKLGAFFA